MAYEQKDNSGSLFKNDRKEKETQPDSKGSAKIDGVEYWVSAWRKTPDGKKPFLSLSFQRKDEQPSSGTSQPQTQAGDPEPSGGDLDDIPW